MSGELLTFFPTGILCFFVVMTVAEGGGRRAVSNKLKDMYFPTLKTSYFIWPAVQIVNFRWMPIQLQLVSFCHRWEGWTGKRKVCVC